MTTTLADYSLHAVNHRFHLLCHSLGDINEHLPTLKMLAEDCNSVFETGVRGCVSSWAFCAGLLSPLHHTPSKPKSIFMNDINECNIQEFVHHARNLPNLDISHQWCNNLELELKRNYDLTFIDTWHVYAQLKRELAKFAPFTNKYIVLHDTEIDGIHGETIRNKWNAHDQCVQSGFPIDEINKGLQPAIDEFLSTHSEWKLKAKYNNNNGLTILERCPHIPYPPVPPQ